MDRLYTYPLAKHAKEAEIDVIKNSEKQGVPTGTHSQKT
jgi:hypothetical protein